MAFYNDKTRKSSEQGDKRPATSDEQKALLEETLLTQPAKVIDMMTDEQIVEIAAQYRPSTPIKIPNELLDPNYEYRFVNRAMKNWRRRRGTGWTPITESGDNRLQRFLRKGVHIDDIHMGTHVDSDGFICLSNDLVLCFIVKRIAEAIRKSLSDEQRSRMRASRSMFHDAGKLAGISTYDKEG